MTMMQAEKVSRPREKMSLSLGLTFARPKRLHIVKKIITASQVAMNDQPR